MPLSIWALVLAFCFSPASLAIGQESRSAGKIEIEIGFLSTGGESLTRTAWMGFGGQARGGGEWIRNEILEFEKKNPHIRVIQTSIERPIRSELKLDRIPRLPKNIVGIDSWQGYEIAYLAEKGDIVPITNFLPDPDLSLDDFYPNLFDSVTYDGEVWGIPWASDPLVLVCNWPLFEEAGISEPPKTWREYIECAKALTKDTNGDGTMDQRGIGIVDIYEYALLTLTLTLQGGGTVLDKDGIDLGHPALRSAVETIRTIIASGRPRTDSAGAQLEQTGMVITPANRLNLFPDSNRYVLAPLPTLGEPVTVSYGRLYLAVRPSTPEEEEASWELIKWISRRDVAMPQYWGGYPCRRDFVQRPDFVEKSKNGIRNLELLYTANAMTRDPGPHYLNRREGLGAMWLVLSQGVFRKPNIPMAQLEAKSEAAARDIISPMRQRGSRSALFD